VLLSALKSPQICGGGDISRDAARVVAGLGSGIAAVSLSDLVAPERPAGGRFLVPLVS
jgi:hypothetical protein